jgi:hypothetical protein
MAQRQINVSMPKEWFDQLEQLARSYSHRKSATPSRLAIIRRAVKSRYQRVFRASAPKSEPACPASID